MLSIGGKNYYYLKEYKFWKVYDEQNNELAAFTIYFRSDYLEIHRLKYKDSSCRTNGVAKALIEKVIGEAKSLNKNYVLVLAKSSDHIEFLRELGFLGDRWHPLKQTLQLKDPPKKKWWI